MSRRKSLPVYSGKNIYHLVRGGSPYFELLLNLIERAEKQIHLQVYIFEDDYTGNLVADALKSAARRKVEVYLMVDGYASQVLKPKWINSLRRAGVRFRFFQPLLKSKYFYFGRRLHHKLVVVDGKYALVGGINISNRYNDLENQPAWLDLAVFIEGEISLSLCVLAWKTWKSFPLRMRKTPCELNPPDLTYILPGNGNIRLCRNDWVRRKNEITITYLDMIRNAQKDITILCSYFLPGKVFRKAINEATKRGVKIRAVTAGPSDVQLTKLAERWLYDWLLRNHIEIYEYQPTILHAKTMVCDHTRVTIGSFNINDISTYASIELNLDIMDPVFARNLQAMMDYIIENQCVRISQEQHKKSKNILIQFIRWGAYQTIRLLFHLVTFYYREKK